MSRIDLFHTTLRLAEERRLYLGTGNPLAPILIVGKECADRDSTESELVANNLNGWSANAPTPQTDPDIAPHHVVCDNGTWRQISGNYRSIWPYKGQLNKILRGNNGGTSRTWYNYQKIYDLLLERPAKHPMIDFHRDFFLSELSQLPAPSTSLVDRAARQTSIATRLEILFRTPFFLEFPIVILACDSNETINRDYFNGKFHPAAIYPPASNGVHPAGSLPGTAPGGPVWVHYDTDYTKLVIHCYQLSRCVPDTRLRFIAATCRDFLRGRGIRLYGQSQH